MKNLGVALGAAAKAAPESYKTFSEVRAFNEKRKAKKGDDEASDGFLEKLKVVLRGPEAPAAAGGDTGASGGGTTNPTLLEASTQMGGYL